MTYGKRFTLWRRFISRSAVAVLSASSAGNGNGKWKEIVNKCDSYFIR